jgi:PhoPQ-activated pathogenicity-related protein
VIVYIISKREVRTTERIMPEEQWIVEVTVYLPYGEKVFRVGKVVIDGREYSAEDEYMREKLFGLMVEARRVEVGREGNIFVALISTA